MRVALLPLMATLLPLSAAAALATAPATTMAPAHVLPMWMQGNHPAVAVNLDGRVEPLRFVVDSAAGATLVDDRIARRYGLEDSTAVTTSAQGASSSAAQLRRLRSTWWQLGGLRYEASAVQAKLEGLPKGDDPAIDGIIGNDVTSRWDTRWDFVNGTLALYLPGALGKGAACQANALPARQGGLRNFAFISVQLGSPGIKAMAVVDTGAAQTVLNMAAARALGLRTDGSDARVRLRAEGTQGLGGQPQSTWLYELAAMSSQGWQHPGMEVRISALSVFKSIGLEDHPALILGADAMLDGQVDISAGADRICLHRPLPE